MLAEFFSRDVLGRNYFSQSDAWLRKTRIDLQSSLLKKFCFDRNVKDYFKSFFSLSLLLTLTLEVLIYQGKTCHVLLLEMEGDVKMKLSFKETLVV